MSQKVSQEPILISTENSLNNNKAIRELIFRGIKDTSFTDDCLLCITEIKPGVCVISNSMIQVHLKELYQRPHDTYGSLGISQEFEAPHVTGVSYPAHIIRLHNEIFYLYNKNTKTIIRLHIFDLSDSISYKRFNNTNNDNLLKDLHAKFSPPLKGGSINRSLKLKKKRTSKNKYKKL